MTLHLEQGSENLSQKEPDSQYFRFCRPDGLCYNYSALSQQHKSSHKGCRNEWVCPCSNKTLPTKTGSGLDLAICDPLIYNTENRDRCQELIGRRTVQLEGRREQKLKKKSIGARKSQIFNGWLVQEDPSHTRSECRSKSIDFIVQLIENPFIFMGLF